MKSKNLIVLACSLVFSANVFANNTGYVGASHDGIIVRDAEESCIHTDYFDKAKDGLSACGEGVAAESPVVIITQKVITQTVSLSDKDSVLFEFDKSSLTENGSEALASFMAKLGDVSKVTIAGYTDAIGDPKYNMQLSIDRANAVKDFFVKHGFDADKVIAEGFGEESAIITADCLSHYGKVPSVKINKLDRQLASAKFKRKHLTRKLRLDKARLMKKLAKLQQQKDDTLACTAPDRKVVFTIEHTKEISKIVNVKSIAGQSSDDSMGNATNSTEVANLDDKDDVTNSAAASNSTNEVVSADGSALNDSDKGDVGTNDYSNSSTLSDTKTNPAPTDVLANPVLPKEQDEPADNGSSADLNDN